VTVPHPYADLSLEELVGRARAGDAAAFARLHHRYVDEVYRYVYVRVGGADLAEDLTAAAMLRAQARIAAFSWSTREIGAWLVLAARNLIQEQYGVDRYRIEADVGEDADEALLDRVRRLPSDQQECVSLRFLQGFSVSDTARILGVSSSAVVVLQWQALRALVPDSGLDLFEPAPDDHPQESAEAARSERVASEEARP
jgi:RNA polymerase sigma-70 factor, ECF subfamily